MFRAFDHLVEPCLPLLNLVQWSLIAIKLFTEQLLNDSTSTSFFEMLSVVQHVWPVIEHLFSSRVHSGRLFQSSSALFSKMFSTFDRLATEHHQTTSNFVGSTQRRTFRNILQWAWNLPGLRELACHRRTAFPGKSKSVLHSQEDGKISFSANCITWVNYVRFITNIQNFSKFSKTVKSSKKISPLRGDSAHLIKSFLKSLTADVFHLASNT